MTTVVYYKEIARMARHNPQIRRREQRDGLAIALLAQRLAPRDTGDGARSIHEEEQPDGTWRVSWDAAHGYMRFQELGTEFVSAQHFLRTAAKRLER